jgi:hypothetical protein
MKLLKKVAIIESAMLTSLELAKWRYQSLKKGLPGPFRVAFESTLFEKTLEKEVLNKQNNRPKYEMFMSEARKVLNLGD